MSQRDSLKNVLKKCLRDTETLYIATWYDVHKYKLTKQVFIKYADESKWQEGISTNTGHAAMVCV